jgi:drug/metabolite transporter (DMT)-like permease
VAPHRAVASLTLCVALWGMVFVAVHELLPVLDPLQMTTLRFVLVSLIFLVLIGARAEWRPRFTRREWGLCVAAGLLAVPMTQLASVDGQRFLSPPIASLIVTTAPAVAAVLGASFLGERLGVSQVTGFALAFAGVALIVAVGAGTGADAGASNPLHAAITVLGPVSWALYTLVSKPLAMRHHAVTAAGVALIVGTISLAPALPHAAHELGGLTVASWGWLVFLAVGGTLAPYLLWSMGLRSMDVSRTTAFMYLVPVFATTWSMLLLGTPLTAVTVVGGAAVLTGVVLTQHRASTASLATEGSIE